MQVLLKQLIKEVKGKTTNNTKKWDKSEKREA